MKRKKLTGGSAFDTLMGKLAHVPKAAADQADKAWRKARKRKKKRKSD